MGLIPTTRVWVRTDSEFYREMQQQDLINTEVVPFPKFDTIPNELPRDTRHRWRTEYMSLALRQHDYLAHLVANVYFRYADLAFHEPEENHSILLHCLRDTLRTSADKFTAHRWTSLFQPEVMEVFRGPAMSKVTEVEVKYALYGGREIHTIHLTPVRP